MLTRPQSAITPSTLRRSPRPAPRQHPSQPSKPADEPLTQTMHLMGAVMSHSRNSEIFGEGRGRRISLQGYQRLRAHLQDLKGWPPSDRRLLLSGEVFGLSFDNEHAVSAEAIAEQ